MPRLFYCATIVVQRQECGAVAPPSSGGGLQRWYRLQHSRGPMLAGWPARD